MKSLLRNIRFYVLLFSFILSACIAGYVLTTNPVRQSAIITLTQLYGLIALTYLYLALLAGPFCFTFQSFPLKAKYMKARRAIGVSAFYFAFLHATLAFFGQLGGFAGLPFLANNYLIAIGLSFVSLLILFFMAITSVDKIIAFMTFKRWKLLHRLVYLAGILTLIHVLMLGSHFSNLSKLIPLTFFLALAFLLLLEALRVDAYIEKKNLFLPKLGVSVFVVLAAVLSYGFFLFTSPKGVELSIHAEHIRLAKEAQNLATEDQNQTQASLRSSVPGLSGDRTKRFSVSFEHPETVLPSHQTDLQFFIYDASSGNPVTLFNTLYEKKVHLIIVDESLTYYSHIHPEQEGNEFFITTSLPHDGIYHIYLDFQPFGAIEQQFAFTLPVGKSNNALPQPTFDMSDTKRFGRYEVSLRKPSPLLASDMSVGLTELSFTLTNTQTNSPVTTLHPYLGAFGHLVLINTTSFDYIHVHPFATSPLESEDRGGPTVRFIPLGLYGPIKPGTYRVFAQFSPDGTLVTSDFTLEVQ